MIKVTQDIETFFEGGKATGSYNEPLKCNGYSMFIKADSGTCQVNGVNIALGSGLIYIVTIPPQS